MSEQDRIAKQVADLGPKSDADLAKELHGRLTELLGETVDLLNQPQWRHLNVELGVSRDVTGRWFVTGIAIGK